MIMLFSIIILLIFILFFLMNLMMSFYECNKNFFYIYECGYDCIYWIYNKMNLHFFKIGIIFIVFDLELMFMIIMLKFDFNNYYLAYMIIFFIYFTLILEWSFSSLKWKF